MTPADFNSLNVTIRPGVVVMDAPPELGDGVWRARHESASVGAFPPGWWAHRTEREGHGLLCSTAGRFATEADARFWCRAFNGGTAEEQARARQLAEPVPGF